MPRCERCDTDRPRLHRHHVKPRHLGGTWADGWKMLCANCHEDEHLELTPRQRARAEARRAARPSEERLRQLYEVEGLTLRQIGARLGSAPSNVQLWLGEYGIQRRAGKPPLVAAPEGVDLAALYENETAAEIAVKFGVSSAVVLRWLREAGVAVRRRGGRPEDSPPDRSKIVAALKGHSTVAAAARALGMKETTLRGQIKRLGIPTPEHVPPSAAEVEAAYEGSGYNIVAMAFAMGVSYSTADRWLTQHGIERRGKVGRPRKAAVG